MRFYPILGFLRVCGVTLGVTLGVLRKKSFMTYCSYLVRKTPTSSYLLRIQIPRDLREYFGRNQFKISLNSGIHSQSLLFAKVLYLEVQSIFSSIRMGTISKITVKQVKDILRDKIERTLMKWTPSQGQFFS